MRPKRAPTRWRSFKNPSKLATSSRGLLDLEDWTKSELVRLFQEVDQISKQSQNQKRNQDQTRSMKGVEAFGLLAFFEPSTRTRVSFEAAGLREGLRWISISGEETSLQKGENFRDTFETLAAYRPTFIVVRHPQVGFAHWVQEWTGIPVLNAGDGAGAHPTQGLLDAYTIWKQVGTRIKPRIALLGDLERSRVARSDLEAFRKLGWRVVAVDDETAATRSFADAYQLTLIARSKLKSFDYVSCFRLQKERGSQSRAACLMPHELNPEARVLHPGPVIWGEDLSKEFLVEAESRLLVSDQVQNGLLVRQALIRRLLQRGRVK